ncbi:unnamed protein product [Didymodactylos carnosus]|uniref:Ubiquitin-like domain-containing protein n=1 Tax=Didymodactylos carnosus TaxID=1234261 RepID=A0A813XRK6_9BILA|nr:unnamed protein product [Didymodactylos carnosus]CAF1069681.1 unnamed protein product [Didymodactylos carnosus]CAF3656293.1 unnamed protein product [Didymodactylos carnosus]CAF3834204.1 unnamed protein product [Didymodactylos carnosus]
MDARELETTASSSSNNNNNNVDIEHEKYETKQSADADQMPLSSNEDKNITSDATSIVEKDTPASSSSTTNTISLIPITIKIKYKTQTFDIKCGLYDTLKDLKEQIDKLTDIDPKIQKLVYKTISTNKSTDATTLKDLNITDGTKLLLIGATRSEMLSTTAAATGASGTNTKDSLDDQQSKKKEPLSKMTQHAKILKSGKPDNAGIGIRNVNEALPSSLDGMYMSTLNQREKRVRLTFKLELDEVWVNTAETTMKIQMNQIRNVIDEPIEGHEEYSIVGLQKGTTEQSIIWIYWVPSQYVKAIRQAILSDN